MKLRTTTYWVKEEKRESGTNNRNLNGNLKGSDLTQTLRDEDPGMCGREFRRTAGPCFKSWAC